MFIMNTIIIKFSSEITIKSRSVRILFIKILTKNIRIILKKYSKLGIVIQHWDYLEIKYNKNYEKICTILMNIPGIHHFLLVKKNILYSLPDIYDQVMLVHYDKLIEKAFCVRVKRTGKHNFTSQDIEHYLGNRLRRNIKNAYVNLTTPEVVVYLEIKNNYFFIIIKRYSGLGGLPLGTQQELISLISGGFDSAVSSYMLIRRGCIVHYCYFNLSGITNSVEVYNIAYYLWNKFSKSHTVKFISVDFSKVIEEIILKIKNNHMSIVLKRMMIRVASAIAHRWKINALITGEVLGQVSSQTLNNLKLIDKVSNCLIFRPLIAYDKENIINIAKKIGTEIFSKIVPEYCAILSDKPTAQAIEDVVKLEESYFDFSILDKVIIQAYTMDIQNIPNKIMENYKFLKAVTTTTMINDSDIILDIRTEFEQINKPLHLINNIRIQKIPFYQLNQKFFQLNPNKVYLLYCDNGVISKIYAAFLHQQGFYNVKVYHPSN